jgi:hypothetical protein
MTEMFNRVMEQAAGCLLPNAGLWRCTPWFCAYRPLTRWQLRQILCLQRAKAFFRILKKNQIT